MFVKEVGPAGPEATLFLHGQTFDGTCWDDVLPAMPGRCLVVDLPGQGQSRAEPVRAFELLLGDLERELAARGVQRVSLVGHSLGAYLSIGLAVRAQVSLRKLVLLSPAAGFDAPAQAGYQQLIGLLRQGADPVAIGLAAFYAPGFLDAHPAQKAKATAFLQRVNVPALIAELEQLAATPKDWRPELVTIRAPTLVRVGALDNNTPPAGAKDIAQRIARATLEVVPGVGHILMLEDLAGTRDSLVRFLK